MNRKVFVNKHLSALSLVIIYIVMVCVHLFIDSFVLESQIWLIITMLPFILIGTIIDFIINHNKDLKPSYAMLARLTPLGIFAIMGITSLLEGVGREVYDIFNYLPWLFIALPFMIASYYKESHRRKLLFSGIGTAFVIVIYLYLCTLTDELNGDTGCIIYFISIFMMLYSASGIKKLPFLSTIVGLLNAILLLWLRFSPITDEAILKGWDYDIAFSYELIIGGTFLICILIRLLEVFQRGKD